MNPRDWLTLANDLSVGDSEAEWRIAVGRAYYSAFHVGRELLERCRFMPPDGEQIHGYVWLRLQSSGHPDVVRGGGLLRTLRGNRNWADYDLHHPIDQSDAAEAVGIADTIVQILDQAAASATVLPRITAAMCDYERDILKQVTHRP
jgi:hypothetical protein